MSNLYEYKKIGKLLGSYIHKQDKPTTAQIQGFLSDLLIDDYMLAPMKDLISRPTFLPLCKMVDSGKVFVLRDSLLHELSRSYLPEVVTNARSMLNGMLAIDEDIPGNTTRKSLDKWALLSAGALLLAILGFLFNQFLPAGVQTGHQDGKLPRQMQANDVINSEVNAETEAKDTTDSASNTTPLNITTTKQSQPEIAKLSEPEQIDYLIKRCQAALSVIMTLYQQRPDIANNIDYHHQLSEFWAYVRSAYPEQPLMSIDAYSHLMQGFPLVRRDYALSVQIAQKAHSDVLSPFMKVKPSMDQHNYRTDAFLKSCGPEHAAYLVLLWRKNDMKAVDPVFYTN